MDYDKYKNTKPYPAMPPKPRLPKHPTAAEARDYADGLEAYETAMVAYRAARDDYHAEQARMDEQFKQDALADVGLTGHPRADKAYAFAWDHGHASGYSEVYYYLSDVADVLID